jgi:ferredoxin-thioredoxin reductase catalytic chain
MINEEVKKVIESMIINEKVTESMILFAENYTKSTNTYFCYDLDITASVIQGLSENKQLFGAPLCPCRYYDDKEDEISLAYWNCPCVPMRERKECHCMLFLTPDNEWASRDQSLEDYYSFDQLV